MMRKGTHPPGGGQDRWLLSYADFVTLLLAFFIAMYGISTIDPAKLGPAASSLRVAFEGDGRQEGPLPVRDGGSVVPPTPVQTDPLAPVQTDLRVRLDDALRAGRLELLRDSRGLVVSLPESATFPPASTEVTAGARELIARVGAIVQASGLPMRIEGHTDNVPIRTSRFRSNWELSTARASTVIAFLIETLAYDPARLSAAGYAEFHPRVQNDTPENRARNRRVDIVILEEKS
jgi:chemotaxis protein MotB